MGAARIRFGTTLALACLGLCLGAAAAQAGSISPLILFRDTGGIWAVSPGHPSSAHLLLADPNPALGAATYDSATWSPNGAEFAYVYRDASNNANQILLANRSGRRVGTALSIPEVRGQSYFGGPLAWSPNGRQIAYVCYHKVGINSFTLAPEYQADVCVVDVTTHQHRTLAASTDAVYIQTHEGCDCRMSWNRNGLEIATTVQHPVPGNCIGGPCAQNDVGVIDVKSGRMSLLTTGGALFPAYSPDGHEIVVYQPSGPGGLPPGIDILGGSGRLIRNVVPDSDIRDGARVSPSWAPDGKSILFSTMQLSADNGNFDVFEVGLKTGHITQITNTPDDSFDAAWAPTLTTCTVPRLTGKTLSAAKALLTRAACTLGTVSGPKRNRSRRKVVSQSPRPNVNRPAGTKVNVKLG